MIRLARPEDHEAILGLLRDCGLLTERLDYSAGFSGLALVMERQGTIVAFCQMLLAHPYAVLTEMAVTPSCQHRGYGVRLIEACELVCRTQGIRAWYTCTWLSNDAVVKSLERYGAECTGQGVSFRRRLT